MRPLLVLAISVCLLSACESRDGTRSDLATFFMNIGQIAYDSAKQANRPEKEF